MDFNKLANQAKSALSNSGNSENSGSSGNKKSGSSGLMDIINNAAGGGEQGEKNEDYLDKGIDAFQEHILKQGQQSNETAIEQAKDEAIASFIRNQYKSTTGKEFPIKDKERKYDM